MTAVYPGSFDPVTFGHIDIITRASGFVDRLIVAVLGNPSKNVLFTAEERVGHLKEVIVGKSNIEVESFEGLLVDFAKRKDADCIIRGLRAVTDFEYEFQMALTNRSMTGDLETLFISTSTQYLYLSSSIVKEIAKFGGNIDNMVPPEIKRHIQDKYRGI